MKDQISHIDSPICFSQSNFFRLMLDNINEAFVLLDKDFIVLESNRQAKTGTWNDTGVPLYPGVHVLDIVDVERRPFVMQLLDDVLKGCQRKTEYIYRHADGSSSYFENTLMPARNDQDEIVGIIVFSKDVTTQKRTELAIVEAEERWQFAFEASNQAAWDWNMQTGEIIYSSSYKKMYGFVDDELKNDISEWVSRIHPEDRKKVEKDLSSHTLSENPYYETTYRIQLKSGEYKWVMARGKIIGWDDDEKPVRMIGTHTDLTEKLEAEAALRKMNERFVYASKASSQVLWEWDALTNEFYVSPTFTELFGWSTDAVKNFYDWTQFLHPEEKDQLFVHFHDALQQKDKSIWQEEYRFRKADGSYAVVGNKAYIIRDENGAVQKIIGAVQDITTQKLTEEELFKSNERYDIMLKATSDLLWEWDTNSLEVYRSKSGIKAVYGLDDESLVKTHAQWLGRIHEDDKEYMLHQLNKIQNGKHMQIFETEYRFLNGEGTYNYIHGRGILLTDADGKPVRMIGAEQNISERKRLEQEILENELEYKKLINQATVDSQEQERSEIGRELHDNINQVLTTTKLYLELALSNEDMMKELVRKSSKNISSLINEIRQLSRSLMDPTIGDLGIVDSINDLVENINLTRKINVSLKIDKTIENVLDRNQKLTIFRTIQESLNNVIRHAKANSVVITIDRQADHVALHIIDDGVGFLKDSVKKGAGLKNITNRVYLINGTFQIKTKPGEGCRINICFPIK